METSSASTSAPGVEAEELEMGLAAGAVSGALFDVIESADHQYNLKSHACACALYFVLPSAVQPC
jgi:hypothetical protein